MICYEWLFKCGEWYFFFQRIYYFFITKRWICDWLNCHLNASTIGSESSFFINWFSFVVINRVTRVKIVLQIIMCQMAFLFTSIVRMEECCWASLSKGTMLSANVSYTLTQQLPTTVWDRWCLSCLKMSFT